MQHNNSKGQITVVPWNTVRIIGILRGIMNENFRNNLLSIMGAAYMHH